MIKSFLKGVVIGIANIVPGVSGGTMMVAMGIYDKLIHCITHLFSEFKKSVLFLLPIAVGMVAAIAGRNGWQSHSLNMILLCFFLKNFPSRPICCLSV